MKTGEIGMKEREGKPQEAKRKREIKGKGGGLGK